MWSPLREGAAAVVNAGAAGMRMELFKAKISCASSSIHSDSDDTKWYSVTNSSRATVGESLPQRRQAVSHSSQWILPDWHYNVRIDVEMLPSTTCEQWVEDVIVNCWKQNHGI